MPGLVEPNQVGKAQDLSSYITNIEREDTPLFTMLPKDTVSKTTFETQVDDYGDTDNIEGVGSNEDADSFDNMAENRGIVENSVMKMWEKPAVDDMAENVNENPALQQGEYANAVKKATVRLKFRGEKLLLSQVEASKQDGTGTKYRTCSIGGFIKATAPSGTQVVPTRFRPASAQIYASTLAAFAEKDAHDILQEIFEATNGKGKFKGFCGSELKQAFSLMSIFRPNVSSNTIIRQINQTDTNTLETSVDILTGDFGVVELIPTTRMRYFDGSAVATSSTLRRGSGLILDLDMWGLAFKRRPRHMPLADKGGGPRGIVDMIFGLRGKNPKGNGAINITS